MDGPPSVTVLPLDAHCHYLQWRLLAMLPLTPPFMRLSDPPTLGHSLISYSVTTSAVRTLDGIEQWILVVGRVSFSCT